MKTTFRVAMDNEQKAIKNRYKVTIDVDFTGVPTEVIEKHAIANMKVHWQSQIRNNWDKFIKEGVPAKMTFGDAIYTSTKSVMTEEKAEAFITNKLTPEAKAALIARLQASLEEIEE